MVKVVITGGSGFIAQHLIKQYPDNIPIYHKQCELTNLETLKLALKNKNVVFHLGRKRFEMLFDPEKEVENSEAYIRDNIEVECFAKNIWYKMSKFRLCKFD
uniref:NAD-dependent epimerase/dehydratase domain-containing protein n=1 Tax=Panagrolaimus superbus TaxID=310955 RepID=A0A914YH29_9BILA